MKSGLALAIGMTALLCACGDSMDDDSEAIADEPLPEMSRPGTNDLPADDPLPDLIDDTTEEAAESAEEADEGDIVIDATPEFLIDDTVGFAPEPMDDAAGFDPTPVDPDSIPGEPEGAGHRARPLSVRD